MSLTRILAADVVKVVGQSALLLPVEIRKSRDGTLVRRTVLRSLAEALRDLGAGDWTVTLSLLGTEVTVQLQRGPSGEINFSDLLAQISSQIGEAWGAVAPLVTKIAPQARDWSLRALGQFVYGLIPDVTFASHISAALPWLPLPAVSVRSGTAFRRSPIARLCFFRGSAIDDELTEVPPSEIYIQEESDWTRIAGKIDDGPLIVQLLEPDKPNRNLLLPFGAALRLSLEASGKRNSVRIAVSLGDELADQTAQLRSEARLDDLTTIAQDLDHEEIRSLATRSTAAALALTYLLLRTRDPAFVAAALDSLNETRASACDVAVIRAELAARNGQHEAAVMAFLKAGSIGIPLFAVGLGYLVDRLRLYEKAARPRLHPQATPQHAVRFSPTEVETIENVLGTFERFSAHCDFAIPVTTYTGGHPARPGSTTLERTEFEHSTGFGLTFGNRTVQIGGIHG